MISAWGIIIFKRSRFLVALSLLSTLVVVNDSTRLLAQSQKMSIDQSLNRKSALAKLRGCTRSLSSEGCNEDTAEYLIGLYKRGDKALLSPLLDAGLVSDGALSESLGSFYGELLWKEPRELLRALNLRPQKAQHKLAWLAATMDGSGMPKEMLIEARSRLRKIAGQRHSSLAGVAKLCLVELDKANNQKSPAL